jgi:hypothetical protein
MIDGIVAMAEKSLNTAEAAWARLLD